MRILLVHNRYQQPGGEDVVAAAEASLLRRHGHDVLEYVEDNSRVTQMGHLSLALNSIWSLDSYRRIRETIRLSRPDVVHLHNTFQLVSPSAYFAANAEGVPVVQTLHNYRLLCPNALLYRERRVCEDCIGRGVPWPGVVHACYRKSRLATAAVATMLATHRVLGTWQRRVTVYIALTEFAREMLVRGGLPSERVVVKPNFLYPDPGEGSGDREYALFVGRLSPEKGVKLLLHVWERLGKGIALRIVGDGPLAPEVASAVKRLPQVEWLGRRPSHEVHQLMGRAAFLVFPSQWYEGLPLTAVESLAKGTPIIASRLGAMTDLVRHQRTGLLFRPGDSEDLARCVEWAWTHRHEMREMGKAGRREYEAKYTADRNYESLLAVYGRAIARQPRGHREP